MTFGVYGHQTLLLPGNHDELHFDCGRDLLQPLEMLICPSPFLLTIRRPTLINKEILCLPPIRCPDKLQKILAEAKRVKFAHIKSWGVYAPLCITLLRCIGTSLHLVEVYRHFLSQLIKKPQVEGIGGGTFQSSFWLLKSVRV